MAPVNKAYGFRQFLILLFLLLLITGPRPLAGVANLRSALLSLEAGDSLTASTAIASAAARIPWWSGLWGLAGRAAWQADQIDQAIAWFSQGESRHALSMSDWLVYGDSFAALGDLGSAMHIWELGILQHGISAEAASRLGMGYQQAGDFPKGIEFLEKALVIAPDDADVHFQLGLMLGATAPEKALVELMQAAALDPAFDPPVSILRAELNRAFLVENRAYQFTVSGRALASQGEWVLAAEAFRRAIEADGEYAEAWAWLGEALQQEGLDGHSQLEQALLLDSHSASIHALNGFYWMRQGEPVKALAAFEKAAALEPENSIWEISQGDAASSSGDLLLASQHYLRAVELTPEDPAAWRALALFSLENDTDVENSGLIAARQLLSLARDDWLTFDIAGQVATRLGAQVEAEFHLLKSISLAPLEPAPHFHLALAYLESGQNSRAFDKLMDTLTLDPEGSYGTQASRLLMQYFP